MVDSLVDPKEVMKWTEDDLLRAVIQLAHATGWLCFHQRPARTAKGWRTAVQGDVGFPDLVLARGARNGKPAQLWFWELKADNGKLSDNQVSWFRVLNKALDGQAMMLRPRNWELIVKLLE